MKELGFVLAENRDLRRDLDYLRRRVWATAYYTLGGSDRSAVEIRAQTELENALQAISGPRVPDH